MGGKIEKGDRLNKRVLIVDDEPSLIEVTQAYLEREGLDVYAAASGQEGLALAEQHQPALIVLDLMLPDMSGEEVCREIRSRSDTPILMLTAKSSESERVAGLELGADDYLIKPFSPRELVARVHAILRRTGDESIPLVKQLSFDNDKLRIDTVRHEVFIRGKKASLTPSEYRLLVAMAQYPQRVYSRFELINRIQGYDFEGYERTIDVHVKNLRKKIEVDPHMPRYIETAHGIGYRLGVERSS